MPALSNIIKEVESNQPERSLSKAELPKCEQCDGLLRPNVVWFGETPKHLNTIYPLLEKTDLMLVIGTSSTVSLVSMPVRVLMFMMHYYFTSPSAMKHYDRYIQRLALRLKPKQRARKWQSSILNLRQVRIQF